MPKKPKKSFALDKISATSIETFLQCKLKYFYNYFSDEEPIQDRTAFDFGTSIHHGLEFIGNALKENKPLTDELCEEAIKHYLKKCAELSLSKLALIEEGKNIIKARIKKHNDKYKVLEVEYKFKDVTTDGGVKLNGFADLIMEMDPTTAVIVDYKTSKVAKTQYEADHDIQLSIYDYMFAKKFPHYEHTWLILDFVRSNVVVSQRTPESRKEFGFFLEYLYDEMLSLKKEDIKPSINKFCNWCGFKHLCESYQERLKKKFLVDPISNLNEDKFIDEWEQLGGLEKLITNRKKELKEWAKTKLEDTGEDELYGNKKIIYSTQREIIDYNLDKLITHIDLQHLPKFVSIDNKKLEQFIEEEQPTLAHVLPEITTSRFSEVGIKTKFKKKMENTV